MRSLVLLAIMLIGCYAPDYTTKACVEDSGCPGGYHCLSGFCRSQTPTKCEDNTACVDNGICKSGICVAYPKDLLVENTMMNVFMGYPFDNDGKAINDYPSHPRQLDKSFYLDDREVTVERYQQCVDAGSCKKPFEDIDRKDCNLGKPSRLNHPINCVDYEGAQSYCAFIERRLPTETEWEYAARGPGPGTYLYPWGRDFEASKACFDQTSTCEVAQKARTYLGAEVTGSMPGFYDLAGNVFEWTTSEFCTYTAVVREGQTCGEAKRVIRGGTGFNNNDPNLLRVSARLGKLPTSTMVSDTWHPNLGFRCARDAN